MSSFRSLRPLSSTARFISQTRRAITITPARLSEPKGADAESHSEVRVTSGKPFADGAKVKEGSVSGIPQAREPVEGKSPPTRLELRAGILTISTTCSSHPSRIIQPQESYIRSHRCRQRTRSHGSPLTPRSRCPCPLPRYAPRTRCGRMERGSHHSRRAGYKHKVPYGRRYFPRIPLFSILNCLQFYSLNNSCERSIRRSRYQSIESCSRLHTCGFPQSDRCQSYRNVLLCPGIRQGMVREESE
jgi:hypothetical protein